MGFLKKGNVQTVIDRLQQIMEDRTKERGVICGQIEAARAAVADADRRMNDALLLANDAGYTEAKRDREDAAASVEMHEKRLAMLDAKAVTNGETYDTLKAALISEYEEIRTDANAKIADLREQIGQIEAERDKMRGVYNGVYYRLQKEIGRKDFSNPGTVAEVLY